MSRLWFSPIVAICLWFIAFMFTVAIFTGAWPGWPLNLVLSISVGLVVACGYVVATWWTRRRSPSCEETEK